MDSILSSLLDQIDVKADEMKALTAAYRAQSSAPAKLKVDAYGDSITFGTGASVKARSYLALLASQRNLDITNYAVPNAMAWDQAAYVYGRSIVVGKVSQLMIGTNDHRIYGQSATRLECFKRAHAALLAWLAIPATAKKTGQGGEITYSGTWADGGAYGSKIAKFSRVTGSKAYFSFSGPVLYIAISRLNGCTSSASVAVDGVVVGTLESAGPGVNTEFGVNYGPALYRFGDLGEGAHSVVITVSSPGNDQNFFLDWVGTPSSGPFVRSIGIHRMTVAGYGAYGGSNQNVIDYNAAITANVQQLVGDGLKIQHADTTATVEIPVSIAADGIHPNDQGHAAIAAVVTPLYPTG